MDILYIVIPAYNEEENIINVLNDWYPIVEAHNAEGLSRLVVVDDGSLDSTPKLLDEEEARRPLMTVLHKENGGHGAAIRFGYEYAVEHGADYVFQTDSDGQTIPSEFEPFWRQRKRFDMVIGQRSLREDGAARIMVTRVLKLVLLSIFKTWIPDANTPFRLMKAGALKDALRYIGTDESLTNVCISAIFAKRGRNVLYRQITFRQRQGGVNSINLKKIAVIGKDALARLTELNRMLE